MNKRFASRLAAWMLFSTYGAIALAIIVALIVLPLRAHADSHVITWTPATKNTDGSSIPATGPGSTSGFRIYYGTVSKSYLTPIQLPATAPFSYTLNLPNDGKTYYIAMTQSTSANGANPGGESAKTNELTTTTPPPAVPSAPVINNVTCANCVAWNNLLAGTTGDTFVLTWGVLNVPITISFYESPKKAGAVATFSVTIPANVATYTWTASRAGLYEAQLCNGAACNDSGFRYYLKLAAPGDVNI